MPFQFRCRGNQWHRHQKPVSVILETAAEEFLLTCFALCGEIVLALGGGLWVTRGMLIDFLARASITLTGIKYVAASSSKKSRGQIFTPGNWGKVPKWYN